LGGHATTTINFVGASSINAVSAVGKLEASEAYAFKEWQRTVNSVEKWLKANGQPVEDAKARVKYTLPGPMTILDCIADEFYGEDKQKELIDDLIAIINKVRTKKILLIIHNYRR
jgi:methionine synthase II (cobalamin-independent)